MGRPPDGLPAPPRERKTEGLRRHCARTQPCATSRASGRTRRDQARRSATWGDRQSRREQARGSREGCCRQVHGRKAKRKQQKPLLALPPTRSSRITVIKQAPVNRSASNQLKHEWTFEGSLCHEKQRPKPAEGRRGLEGRESILGGKSTT